MSGVFDKAIATALAPFLQAGSEQINEEVKHLTRTDGFADKIRGRASQDLAASLERQYLQRPGLRYPNPVAFFDDYLRTAYEIGGASQAKGWCADWTQHPSAVLRITAMWNAYEALYQANQATCDEEFLRRIGDHHMEVLLGEKSPMLACATGHRPSKPLKSNPVDKERPQDDHTD